MSTHFDIGERSFRVDALASPSGIRLQIDGNETAAALHPRPGAPFRYELEIAGVRERLVLVRDGDHFFIRLRGRSFAVAAIDPLERARGEARARSGVATLVAPMPGLVIEARTRVGDLVEAGEIVLVIESMKLQTQMHAEIRGKIVELGFATGESFEQGAVLARIEAVREDDS